MSTFVLKTQDLDELGRDWEFPIQRKWFAAALDDTDLRPGTKPGLLRVHAQRNGQDILVQGRIEAAILAECARCLGDAALDFDLEVAVLFSPEHGRSAASAEVEVRPDEVNRDFYNGTEVVLDSIVRELLLLEVPMKPLCSEQCQGIPVPEETKPPRGSFDRSAPDARLAPLLKFKEELSKSEE